MSEVTLMTPEEMRRRLKAGEDAFDLSIEKWERIRDLLKRVPQFIPTCWFDASTCALCYLHDECCFCSTDGYLPCPLATPNYYCNGFDSAWKRFHTVQTPERAQAVIDALKKARGDTQ